MRKILFFTGKCLILSLPLVAMLPRFDEGCRFVLALIVHRRWPDERFMSALPYVSAVKLLPFFILVLAVSGLSVRRRVVSVAAAVALYLLLDAVMMALWPAMPHQLPQPEVAHLLATQMWEMAGRWLLPFLLAGLAIFCGRREAAGAGSEAAGACDDVAGGPI